MAKSKTIERSPLEEAVISTNISHNQDEHTQGTSIAGTNNRANHKDRFTVRLSNDVIEKARDAVYWTPGLTLVDLAERALLSEVRRMEKERGASFKTRDTELKPGRPVR